MGLWRAVVDEVAAGLVASNEAATGNGPVAARLDDAIERFVRFSIALPDLGRFFVDEIAQPGERRNYIIDRVWRVHHDAMLHILHEAAYSDEAGHLFRHEAGHRTDLKPASIPI